MLLRLAIATLLLAACGSTQGVLVDASSDREVSLDGGPDPDSVEPCSGGECDWCARDECPLLCAAASCALLPDAPGTYELELRAEMLQPDPQNPGWPREAVVRARVTVEGSMASICIPQRCYGEQS